MLKSLILVFLGGGLGSLFRYSIGRWVGTLHTHYFPFGTLLANILACFILGLLVGAAATRQDFSGHTKLFWTVGFCGGFSTFSTFSLEAVSLFQSGYSGTTLIYIGLSLIFCTTAILAGIWLGQRV